MGPSPGGFFPHYKAKQAAEYSLLPFDGDDRRFLPAKKSKDASLSKINTLKSKRRRTLALPLSGCKGSSSLLPLSRLAAFGFSSFVAICGDLK
ncbi:hypothetical protein ACLOJK_007194 [Asimina triloba]